MKLQIIKKTILIIAVILVLIFTTYRIFKYPLPLSTNFINSLIVILLSIPTSLLILRILKEDKEKTINNMLYFLMIISIWVLTVAFVFIHLSVPTLQPGQSGRILLPYIFRNSIILGVVSLATIILLIKILRRSENSNTKKTDIKRISIVSKEFWTQSSSELKNLRNVIFISILLAIMITSRALQIPTGFGPLMWRWSFIPWAIAGFLFGPVPGILMGLLYDVIAFYMFPGGFAFSPVFMMLNLLRGLVFGLVLYKARISLTRLIVLMFIINILINTIGGAFAWTTLISDVTFEMFWAQLIYLQLPRNLMVFIPQLAILLATFKHMLPVLKNANMLNDYPYLDDELNVI